MFVEPPAPRRRLLPDDRLQDANAEEAARRLQALNGYRRGSVRIYLCRTDSKGQITRTDPFGLLPAEAGMWSSRPMDAK